MVEGSVDGECHTKKPKPSGELGRGCLFGAIPNLVFTMRTPGRDEGDRLCKPES